MHFFLLFLHYKIYFPIYEKYDVILLHLFVLFITCYPSKSHNLSKLVMSTNYTEKIRNYIYEHGEKRICSYQMLFSFEVKK